MNAHDMIGVFVLGAIVAPLAAFLALLLMASVGMRPTERVAGGLARAGFVAQCAASVFATAAYVYDGARPAHFEWAPWFVAGGYEFTLGVGVDARALGFLLIVAFVTAFIGGVSHRYLHREEGYRRYFLLLLLGSTGMSIVALADALDLFFVGWELVGIASALLIGFFQERPAPARHGLLAFIVYRTCDVGLLAGVVLLHGFAGHGALGALGEAPLPSHQATVLGLLFVVGAMGKSAQFPFTSFLPRAMEGPTTSSAIFYGAVSVHAGAYLLVRTAPIWSASLVVHAVIVLVGAVTALNATIVGRAQTDAKTAIAWSTVSHVGVIFVEIGFGLYSVALAHIAVNAFARSLQFLRAPSVISDHERRENRLRGRRLRRATRFERLLPRSVELWLYRYALERGYVDTFAASMLASVRRALLALDAFDRRLVERVAFEPVAGARTASSPHPDRGSSSERRGRRGVAP
jgi:NADH-quinone oxidoreductase subunit L